MSRTMIGVLLALGLAAPAAADPVAAGGGDGRAEARPRLSTVQTFTLYDADGAVLGERRCETFFNADPAGDCGPFLDERKAKALEAAGATSMVKTSTLFYEPDVPVAVRATFELVEGGELHTFEFKDGSAVTYRLEPGKAAQVVERPSGKAARKYAKQRSKKSRKREAGRG